jgi:hypothetical protein
MNGAFAFGSAHEIGPAAAGEERRLLALRRHPAQRVSPFASTGGAIARSSRQVLLQTAILLLLRAKGALKLEKTNASAL